MRLTRITTRSGDDGSTGLGDGQRVRKDHARIEAIGAVDTLNSTLGLLLCQPLPPSVAADIGRQLTEVQRDLFDVGGELSIPGHSMLAADRLAAVDAWVGHWNAGLPPLAEFILPGGSLASAHAHQARTACRTAERRVITLAAAEPVRPAVAAYLNRLSDLLFVLARVLNRETGVADTLWRDAGPAR